MSHSVAVAMSGGVDSTVTALLLKQRGLRVTGVYMDLGPLFSGADDAEDRRAAKLHDVRQAARSIDVPLRVLDLSGPFESVLCHFVDQYLAGRTPNPCTVCNPRVKFGRLMDLAFADGADLFATGHYARVAPDPDGRPALYRGADPAKDQSYVLFGIERPRLKQILFPLGELTKDEVRRRAADLGLAVADRPGSQDICFMDGGDYSAFIESRRPGSLRPGPIVDASGKELGRHEGVARFTIGQRRGLRLPMGHPVYVVGLDPQHDTVVVGSEDDLLAGSLTVHDANWLVDPPTGPVEAAVKIRYRSPACPATVVPDPDEATRFEVRFRTPVKAATPGQAAVVYDGDRVLGGGWIGKTRRSNE